MERRWSCLQLSVAQFELVGCLYKENSWKCRGHGMASTWSSVIEVRMRNQDEVDDWSGDLDLPLVLMRASIWLVQAYFNHFELSSLQVFKACSTWGCLCSVTTKFLSEQYAWFLFHYLYEYSPEDGVCDRWVSQIIQPITSATHHETWLATRKDLPCSVAGLFFFSLSVFIFVFSMSRLFVPYSTASRTQLSLPLWVRVCQNSMRR